MAIPMLAATTGPLANMFSIAAIVTPWRNIIPDNGTGRDADSVGYPDPRWCIALNIASLVCGCIGNFALLLNFTRRVSYIIALPTTIIMWYVATALLVSAEIAMHIHVPPVAPAETYSQGYWYAVMAAIIYWLSATLLMGNMLGYFLGHYPRHFTLTDHQRTLILQTMTLIVWLAGGAGVFARINGWSFCDALYFADVTILTIGFGDYYPRNDLSRGLLLPYSVGGIVVLGLVVNSINRFMRDMNHDNVFKKHIEKKRARTVNRYGNRSGSPSGGVKDTDQLWSPKNQEEQNAGPKGATGPAHEVSGNGMEDSTASDTHRGFTQHLTSSRIVKRVFGKESKMVVLQKEKDRFNAMRHIQHRAHTWRRWYRLSMSVLAFTLVWCLGALVFHRVEQREQGLTYFQGLYFCYVSLASIGYGDLSPKSNAGKPLFVLWSLIAVPTMTILISDMAETVIASFNRATFTLADWTVLPRAGVWRALLTRNPRLFHLIQHGSKSEQPRTEKRVEEGYQTHDGAEEAPPTLEDLAEETYDEEDHLHRMLQAIRRTAKDIQVHPPKRYPYEEWAEVTRLIRFCWEDRSEAEKEAQTVGIIEWDWIGEDSPMMANHGEPEWILERLCDSLDHWLGKKQRPKGKWKSESRRIKE
ncbi:MAG: hypothetical protein M1823_002456 [Watsoniomyces obsoletus]|nr:MAG: hypothetical protein M1823_002456 [Watsoniomyces obsoletus]